jgi:tRNA (guanine-N(7)-)-methyltransferase subunit TRM82
MPKRPCSLAVTKDGSTIITADKFGDVYSIPLLFTALDEFSPIIKNSGTENPEPIVKTPFVPSANNLTVHSQRNLKALENQKKQTNKPTEKSVPKFEHKLLLGHVSMLTDLALAEFDGRNYIFTADRDEHIRISRGIPQSHIIEGFCLGHTEFISRICIPEERSKLLISGGGDDDIFLWEWASGTLLLKAPLKRHVESFIESNGEASNSSADSELKIAVSAILHVRLSRENAFDDMIVVTCEK